MISRKLKDLAIEEINILELMKDAQKKTFVERTMSSTDYHKAMYEYEKRLNEIKELRTKLRAKRVGIIKVSKELDNLKKEDEDIINQIKNIQRDYFEKHTINNATYERRMESLRLRRAEIEEALTVLETKLAKEKRFKELKKLAFIDQVIEKIKTGFGQPFRGIKKFFKKRQFEKKEAVKPEKIEIQKMEEKIAEKIEEVPVKRISEPSLSSKLFKKVRFRIQNKLSKWRNVLERKRADTQHKQILRLQTCSISDSIRALQLGIKEMEKLNLDTSKARELLNKTVIAFQNERYDEAEKLIDQTYVELAKRFGKLS